MDTYMKIRTILLAFMLIFSQTSCECQVSSARKLLLSIEGGGVDPDLPTYPPSLPAICWEMDEVNVNNITPGLGGTVGGGSVSGTRSISIGKINMGIYFAEGSNGGVQNSTIPGVFRDFTVSLWINPDIGSTISEYSLWALSGGVFLFGAKRNSSGTYNLWVEYYDGTKYIMDELPASVYLSGNQWEHIVVSKLSFPGIIVVYLGGEAVWSTTSPQIPYLVNHSINLGKYISMPGVPGIYDQFAIFSRPLTDAEVRFIYNGGNGSEHQNWVP